MCIRDRPVGTCSTVMVAPGTLTEPEIDEDVSLAAKEKPIKKTDKEIRIFFIILLLVIRLGLLIFYAYFRYLQQEI